MCGRFVQRPVPDFGLPSLVDLAPALAKIPHSLSKIDNYRTFPLLGEAWNLVQRLPRIAGESRIIPYNPRSAGTSFTRACSALKIEDLCFHNLRHEATSRLFKQGCDIPEVAAVALPNPWNEPEWYMQLRPKSLHLKLPSDQEAPRY